MTKRVALPLLICLLFLLSTGCRSVEVLHPLERTPVPASSIQPLQNSEGLIVCTTWSINEQWGYWVTAAHCVTETEDGITYQEVPRLIHNHPTTLLFLDAKTDLAVLHSDEHAPTIYKGAPPIVNPRTGEATLIHIYGYFWGDPVPTRANGVVANLNLRGRMIYDMRVGHGHSGSPVLDSQEHAISLLQMMADEFSGGATYQTMAELDPYWAVEGAER